jgi:hypothetical protein
MRVVVSRTWVKVSADQLDPLVDAHFDTVFPEFLRGFVLSGSRHGFTVLWKEITP